MAQNGKIALEFPMLGLIVATRAVLGVGIGLLIADQLKDKKKAVGAALFAVGAITTIPAVMAVLNARKAAALPPAVA